MQRAARGRAARLDGASVAQHFDRCLGCMACVTACPSGVRYDTLIERDARRSSSATRPRTPRDRAVPRADLLALPVPAPVARCSRRCSGSTHAAACRRSCAAAACCDRLPPRLRAAGGARARLRCGDLFARAAGADARAAASARARVGLLSRLRAARLLPARQRGDGPRARRRGLRRACRPTGRAAAARSSLHAGRERRGAVVRPRADRRLRAPAGRRHRGQRRRLRLASQGVRRRCSRDEPAWAERARAFAAQGARRQRAARRAAAARAAPPAARARRLPRRLPPGARAGRSAPSRARCCAASPASSCVEIPDGDQCCGSAGIYNLIAAGSRRRDRRAQGRTTCSSTGARGAGHRQPRLHAADPEAAARARRDAAGRAPDRDPRRLDPRRPASVLGRRNRDHPGKT